MNAAYAVRALMLGAVLQTTMMPIFKEYAYANRG